MFSWAQMVGCAGQPGKRPVRRRPIQCAGPIAVSARTRLCSRADIAGQQPERAAVPAGEIGRREVRPHQAGGIVCWRGEQHVADFVSEHAAERARQVTVANDLLRRRGYPAGEHSLGRVE